MRYKRVSDIVKLAILLQGMGSGLTIADIMYQQGQTAHGGTDASRS